MIGLSLEDAKSALKAELGVKRMGSKRFLKELESRVLFYWMGLFVRRVHLRTSRFLRKTVRYLS